MRAIVPKHCAFLQTVLLIGADALTQFSIHHYAFTTMHSALKRTAPGFGSGLKYFYQVSHILRKASIISSSVS